MPRLRRPGTPGLGGKRVLVVEDSPAIQDFVGRVLAMEGCDVVAARDGRTGLAHLVSSARYDLLLLDIGLPDISGWQILEHMRRRARVVRRPLTVVFTADLRPSTRHRATELGAAGVILKPVGAKEIVERLRGYLCAGGLPVPRGVRH